VWFFCPSGVLRVFPSVYEEIPSFQRNWNPVGGFEEMSQSPIGELVTDKQQLARSDIPRPVGRVHMEEVGFHMGWISRESRYSGGRSSLTP
jgi:hypothetical protein